VTSDVSQDFRFKAEFADSLAVGARLLRGSRRSQLNVLHAELIEGSSDFDFGGRVKECIGKLFSFSLDNESWHRERIIPR